MKGRPGTIRVPRSSLPVPLGERNWNGFVLGTVCATAGVATWSFVVGGSSASYLNAKMGVAAMLAGGLIGQLLVTLATVPVSTKHGIETVISTKPQLGIRGSYLALIMQYATALGWNTVLMIFFGRSAASILELTGLIDSSARTTAATVFSVVGIVLAWFMVSRGAKSLQKVGPVVAIVISLMAVYLLVVLFRAYGSTEIFSAQPLDPTPNRLLNYTSVVELLIVSTWGWWTYMGGMVRMVGTARRAVLPSMVGLGVAWVLVAIVSLYSALATGEADPTVWAPAVAGDVGGVIVLLFVAFANVSSTLVGAYVATLGVSQIPQVSSRLQWKVVAGLVLAPMLVVVVFFSTEFFDNVDRFMAFIGLMIAPMIGIQIADWYLLGRRKSLRISGLYRHNSTSCYWYLGGFNPAGILALVLGSVTYQLLLNPVTYEPRSPLFKYLTASLPAVLVAAVAYTLLSLLWRKRLAGREEHAGAQRRTAQPLVDQET